MSYADLFKHFKPQVRKVTLSVGDVYVRELTGMQQAQLYDDQKKLSQTDWMAKRILMSLCDSDGKLTEKDTDLGVVSLLSFGDIIKLNSAITSLTKEIEEEAEKKPEPILEERLRPFRPASHAGGVSA